MAHGPLVYKTYAYQFKHYDLQQNLPPYETIIIQNRHYHLNWLCSVHDCSVYVINRKLKKMRKSIQRVLVYHWLKDSEYSTGSSEYNCHSYYILMISKLFYAKNQLISLIKNTHGMGTWSYSILQSNLI